MSRKLEWDANLAVYAKSRVNAQPCNGLSHAGNRKGYGENLYMSSMKGESGIKHGLIMWRDEVSGMSVERIRNLGFSSDTGHATQMLWGSTQRVGCAFGRTSCGSYLSCNCT